MRPESILKNVGRKKMICVKKEQTSKIKAPECHRKADTYSVRQIKEWLSPSKNEGQTKTKRERNSCVGIYFWDVGKGTVPAKPCVLRL